MALLLTNEYVARNKESVMDELVWIIEIKGEGKSSLVILEPDPLTFTRKVTVLQCQSSVNLRRKVRDC